MSLAITSPDKFNTLCCKWGWVTKTIWLDDPGAKRDIDENDLDFLATEAVPTTPKENLTPETLSATRCPDWVENKIREEKRQEAAIIQFYKIEEEELAAYGRFLESNEDDAEFLPNNELDRLLEGNEDIEI